jgi:hypothetical protein
VDNPNFQFICGTCKRKEEEAGQPKLPPLKLRLTSNSPSSRNEAQMDADQPPTPTRHLHSVQRPTPQLFAAPHLQRPVQPVQPWVDGPSLSPRGQALGPPGIHRSEAAYGSPYNGDRNGSSSPVRARPESSGLPTASFSRANGNPPSSPPPFNLPQIPSSPSKSQHVPSSPTKSHHSSPMKSYHMPQPQQNGSSFGLSNPFGSSAQAPLSYTQSFNRPDSSAGLAGLAGSPVKHSPANSPRPANGLPIHYNFNSPHSSFPPSSAHRPSFSPTKHSSPAPLQAHMSSPAPAPVRIAPSPSQMPAQVLPDPIPAPSKHDGMRPVSSHEMSEKSVFPPSQSLSPQRLPQILSPPVKKASPTPEKMMGVEMYGNGNANGEAH